MKLEFQEGDCYIELTDGKKAVVRRVEDALIRIQMQSGFCQDNRLQVTTFDKEYNIIEQIRFITVSQIKKLLLIV